MEVIDKEDTDLEPDELFQKYRVNPQQAKLYGKIFEIFDEGENECVLSILCIQLAGKTHHKIVDVHKGD